MANLSYIDVNKSIITGRLIYKRSWIDVIDKVAFSMLCISLVAYPTLLFFQLDLTNGNGKALAFFILPLIILFGLYGLYRKITEDYFLKIETTNARHKNKELLLMFLKQRGYKVFHQNKEIIIVNDEEELSFNGLWTKTITFIISDDAIYFNMVKNFPKLNPPVVLSHLLLRKDLKKFIAANESSVKHLKK